MKKLLLIVLGLFVVGYWSFAGAEIISVQSGGITLNSQDTTGDGAKDDPWLINETLSSPGTLKFESATGGSPLGDGNETGSGHVRGKWFEKTVLNNTGTTWTSFELELQVKLGTPSPNGDGISFADVSPVASEFFSDQFALYTRIDTTKDYLNFHGGDVADGETVKFWFAITDNQIHNPFYLLETPNRVDIPVPEPATMLLLGSGLIGLTVYGRKKFFRN